MAHQLLFFSQFSCIIQIIIMNSEAVWKTVWMENSVDSDQMAKEETSGFSRVKINVI